MVTPADLKAITRLLLNKNRSHTKGMGILSEREKCEALGFNMKQVVVVVVVVVETSGLFQSSVVETLGHSQGFSVHCLEIKI